MLPAEAFRTRTHRQVLRVLAEQNRRYEIKELAEFCHRSQATISRVIQDMEQFSFINKDTVQNGMIVVSLNSESEYTTYIRDFFKTEYRVERNETVPVDIWNFLERLYFKLDKSIDEFYELFLFGSFAEGTYYAGSDIDIFLFCLTEEREFEIETENETRTHVYEILDEMNPPREVQLLIEVKHKGDFKSSDKERWLNQIREYAPIQQTDKLLSVGGKLTY